MQYKSEQKRRQIRIVKTMTGIIVTVLLAAGAFCIPNIVYSFKDRNTFVKQESIHMELTHFEKEGSFLGQLRSFAKYQEGYVMHLIHMEETNEKVSDEELTQVIQNELNRMVECDVVTEFPQISAQELTSRELYTSYMDGWGGQRDGITFWKVKYQRPQEQEFSYDLEVIVDMEYHRIYGLWLSNESVNEQILDYQKLYKNKNNERILMKMEERQWNFINNIAEYYKVNREETNIIIDGGILENPVKDNVSATMYDEATGEDRKLQQEEKEVDQNCYRLKGSVIFTDEKKKTGSESFLYLNMEYSVQEGQNLLYIGIEQLGQILQL